MSRKILASLVLLSFTAAVDAQNQQRDTSNAANEKVADIIRTFAGRGVQSDGSKPTPADQSVQQFQMRDGFEIDLVASEPVVSQPLFLTWDSRGRMWAVQYRQYQFPAGLKIVRYDNHLRAVFDKVPEPPPHGTPGLDKITVFEDTNGDGKYDSHRDVITGLNIVSSLQVGRGGIWVLNPPYLLFYPDADGDDVPDGDPEVHLSGFGLQDTHSVASSLLWGPDGWLYGANGSTTVGTVSSAVTKGVSFQGQCVWRYHPRSKVFEIYAEGGGNTFSLDIDAQGRVFSGTNYGNTRGMYYPQGSYAEKNWGKHGPLTNPYAFGFFRHMKNEGDDRRFAQAFLIYDGGLFPPEFSGDIVAPNAMVNLVWHSKRVRDGSTYRTVDQSNLAESPDRWFRPVYAGAGPDGAVYLADWYDTRLSHVSPIDDWHKESGRIYRIRPQGSQPKYDQGDLSKRSNAELLACFAHANKWLRLRAVLELGWRGDQSIVPELVQLVNNSASEADESDLSKSDRQTYGSLAALWALNLLDSISAQEAIRWLQHDDAHVRRWVVRIIGDQNATASQSATRLDLHDGVASELAKLAKRETDVQVRSQLASTAKRLSSRVAIPMIRQLLEHDEDVDDPHMPLMNWWAIEAHAQNWSELESMLSENRFWQLKMVKHAITRRLMQRYATAGTPSDLQICVKLVSLAPDKDASELLLSGLNQAFQGRTIPPLPDTLGRAFSEYRSSLGESKVLQGLRQGDQESVKQAITTMSSNATNLGVRIELARAFGQTKHEQAVDPLLRIATGGDSQDAALKRVAMRSLGQYDRESIGRTLAGSFGGAISNENELRATACRTLALRKPWVKALLDELTSWRLPKEEVPPDVVQQLRNYSDAEIVKAVEDVFGKPVAVSAPEKIAEIQRLSKVLAFRTADGRLVTEAGEAETGNSVSGNTVSGNTVAGNTVSGNTVSGNTVAGNAEAGNAEAGRVHFTKKCATCHQLFGEGKQIGPPLDAYDRGNLKFWLPAIIEPSLEIREGFQSYSAATSDGRVITGMISAQDPQTVTFRTADDQQIVLERDDIDELKALRTSLMPEDTLKDLTDKQLKDLFAYLSLGAKK